MVKVRSIRLKGPPGAGPKNIRIFKNQVESTSSLFCPYIIMRLQPRTLDFSQAESNTAVEEVVMNKTQLAGDAEIQLRFVKFQDVQNIQIFVQV